ncbi:MAG TPA: tRNA lysidine(34) synthetase TilS [Steroidobacteraceae bacterium]|jgi:tRNA(Ile)-lysidine synthase|nr:tRNA lysidine(34) synthetase TilS [Steroidobacteraceae bacterium]
MNFSVASLHTVLEASVPAGARGLVVALSGGPDSAALLAAAADPGTSFRGLPLRAVHIDHGLQAAAHDFREACIALCRHLGVSLSVIAAEVRGGSGASLEAAARDARYAALAAQIQPGECLLTAHHRADQAETVLLQALRGAGVKGMSAMPACRVFGAGWHVRPLLEVARSDLRQFGARLREFSAADPMNEDLRFDRVYLREAIWPLFEKRWPGADTALARSARHLAQAQQLLDEAAAAEVARLRDGEALSVPGLRALSAQKRANAVRWWLHESGAELPSAVRLAEALRQILDAGEDQQPSIVWGDMALRRYRQRMFVTAAQAPRLPDARPWPVAMGARVDLGPRLGNLCWIEQRGGLAAERLPPAVSVRRREGGETLRPAQAAKTQTLQHLCQSRGVLPWLRDALPLVFAGNELIAVADLWMDGAWCAAADAPGLSIAWNEAPLVT